MNISAAQSISPAMLAQAQAVGSPAEVLALQQQYQQQTLAFAANSAASQQAAMGALGTQPKSSIGTIFKSLIVTAALGAGIGAAATFLPFIPGGPLMGAAIGAAAGALLGLIRGVKKARSQQDEQRALMMGSQNLPTDPNALGPEMPVGPDAIVAPEAVAAAAATAKSAHKARPTHTIKSGDTLSAIAKMHHITVTELLAANHKAIGINPNMLHIGSRLVIPAHHKAKK